MEIRFSLAAWEQYTAWQGEDKKTIKRINELLKDIVRGNPFDGIGKPEPLKGNLSGFWSRRIDECNRLVYRIQGENGDICEIAQCKGHYGGLGK
ncbi:Txe/YoeB family addiction module toxin [Desulfovibrio sp. OttesenSCG-928-M16]|nr:Txe/YoeB family addiction module toxin [Desulfovibrio sp. OttesenSCG-928-M16]